MNTRLILSVVCLAAFASAASAATSCKGYEVTFQSQDFAWVKLKLEPILKAFVKSYPGSTYTITQTGKNTADIRVIANNAPASAISKLTSDLSAAVTKEPTLKTISDKPSLCPDVSPTLYCKKLAIIAKAGDAAWIKMELDKALKGFLAYYKGCKATVTLGPITTKNGLPTATATVATSCPNAFAKYFSEYKWKYMNSVTVNECGSVKPTVPPKSPIAVKPTVPPKSPVVKPTIPTCKGYTITAKAGDFAWVQNAIKKVLDPLRSQGVFYKLESTGSTTSKLTIRAPPNLWATIEAALKPDNYIISFTPATPDSAFCVAPVTQLCIKLTIDAKAGDFAWIKNAVERSYAGLTATCAAAKPTLTKVNNSKATLTVRYPSSCTGVPAYLKANVKPDNYITKVVAGNC